MTNILANYHTHTQRCGHAAGTEEDYVRAALCGTWQVLGFSDHVPWPYESGFTNPGVRMPVEALPEHIAVLRKLREQYSGQLRLYLGFECEYFPDYMVWLSEMKEAWGLDYLIFGNHFDRTDEGGFYYGGCAETAHIISYTDNALKGMETGLFRYIAHPDLFLMDYPAFDATAKDCARTLLTAAKEQRLPVEYNLQGIRLCERGLALGLGYPHREFWELAAELGNTVIVGSDAHDPQELRDTAAFTQAQQMLRGMGLSVLPCLEELT